MAALADPATYRPDPEAMWERLRPRTGNRRLLGVLRAVAAWREREAQRVNVPRQRVLKDESLLEIAATAPRTPDELARVRGVGRGLAEGEAGASLLGAIEAARALPDSALPEAARGKDGPRPSPALVSLLKVLLAAQCETHDVAPKLVANSGRHRAAGNGGRPGYPGPARLAARGVRGKRAGVEARRPRRSACRAAGSSC